MPLTPPPRMSGNPLFPGWYADPEIHCFEGRYYVYPTTSRPFAEQTTSSAGRRRPDKLAQRGVILDFADILWTTQFAAVGALVRPLAHGRPVLLLLLGRRRRGHRRGVSTPRPGRSVTRSDAARARATRTARRPSTPTASSMTTGARICTSAGHRRCVVARLRPTMRAFNRAFATSRRARLRRGPVHGQAARSVLPDVERGRLGQRHLYRRLRRRRQPVRPRSSTAARSWKTIPRSAEGRATIRF
jgi:hypothetical protein